MDEHEASDFESIRASQTTSSTRNRQIITTLAELHQKSAELTSRKSDYGEQLRDLYRRHEERSPSPEVIFKNTPYSKRKFQQINIALLVIKKKCHYTIGHDTRGRLQEACFGEAFREEEGVIKVFGKNHHSSEKPLTQI